MRGFVECDAEAAGYDGMFGVYCLRPAGHTGQHWDGLVSWSFDFDRKPTDLIDVDRLPLLRDASPAVIYVLPDGHGQHVVGPPSRPKWAKA